MSNPYDDAQLLVAAVRVMTHRNGVPPSTESVCDFLSWSPEQGLRTVKKLSDEGIVDAVSGSFGERLFVRDHLKIESLPKQTEKSGLEAEIRAFQDARKGIPQKVENFKARQEKKRKALFAELEGKLKGGGKTDNDSS